MDRLINTYFGYFNRHAAEDLSNLFDQNVSLEDWNIKSRGLANVVAANKQIFSDHPEIMVDIVRISIIDNIAFAEIKVDIGDGKKLDVLDVIETNPSQTKILKISAFRKF
jgi:hypothetical protein